MVSLKRAFTIWKVRIIASSRITASVVLANDRNTLPCSMYVCVFVVKDVLGHVCLCHSLVTFNGAAHHSVTVSFQLETAWGLFRRKCLVTVKGVLLGTCNCSDLKRFHRLVGEGSFSSLFAPFILFWSQYYLPSDIHLLFLPSSLSFFSSLEKPFLWRIKGI